VFVDFIRKMVPGGVDRYLEGIEFPIEKQERTDHLPNNGVPGPVVDHAPTPARGPVLRIEGCPGPPGPMREMPESGLREERSFRKPGYGLQVSGIRKDFPDGCWSPTRETLGRGGKYL
jgi:hypothetical protein